jgi:hypothetical protein
VRAVAAGRSAGADHAATGARRVLGGASRTGCRAAAATQDPASRCRVGPKDASVASNKAGPGTTTATRDHERAPRDAHRGCATTTATRAVVTTTTTADATGSATREVRPRATNLHIQHLAGCHRRVQRHRGGRTASLEARCWISMDI